MNYYIADLHFGHKNCLKYDNQNGARFFSSIEEHDELIIENWNQVVKPGDTVYILGDVSWKNPTETKKMVERLNGQKILIRGNHDQWSKNSECKKLFQAIYDYKKVHDNGRTVILSHFPIMMWDGQHRESIHLYGHVHNTSEQDDYQEFLYNFNDRLQIRDSDRFKPARGYNVGCMMPYMNYTPRTLDEITNGYNKIHEV